MTNKTDYFENLLLNAYIRQNSAAKAELAPCNLQVALYYDTLSDTTSDTSLLNEVNYGTGTRVSYANLSAAFPAPSLGSMTNTSAIQWTLSLGTTGTIKSVAIVDATPATDRVWWYVGITPISPGAGSIVQYASGALTIVES